MSSKLYVFVFVILLSFQAQASEEKLFCATYYAFYYKDEIQKLPTDKAMHCTMSCYLAVKCPREEALIVGYLKEFWDILGPGDADWNDIEANKVGIKYAKKNSKWYCKSQCLKRYPKRPKRK